MHETIHEAKPLLREGLEKMALNATWRAFQAILGVVQHYLAHFFDGFCRFLQVFAGFQALREVWMRDRPLPSDVSGLFQS